jgi:general secretion pathway protein N
VTRLLVLLCCLLIALVAVEVSYGQRDDPQIGGITTDAGRVMTQAPKPVGPAAGSVDQWTAAALGRPLFAPDRRPAARSGAVDAGLPRLTGVIASPNDAVAIFQPPGDARPVSVRHGETVSGWAVMVIAGTTVSLRKADERLVLRPEFDNPKSSGSAAGLKAPHSRWEAAAPTGLLRARWSNPQLQP